MIPVWLHLLSIAGLFLGAAGALSVAVDVARHPQRIWIMAIVWPVVSLFGTVASLWLYFRYGRLAAKDALRASKRSHETPFPVMVAAATCHCGAGCALGDICAEWLAFAFPAVAIFLGWHSVFGDRTFAIWVLDYLFAFVLGIAFQYFTTAPMRHLGPSEGIVQAIKANALSLTAWQVGMYGFMAFAKFYLFRTTLGVALRVDSAEFWFMMQIAMLCGFLTSYPANWWLLRSGIKEKM